MTETNNEDHESENGDLEQSLTQEEEAESVGSAEETAAESVTSGWSWGAFMFDAPFLIAIRKYTYLLVYLLMLIPILNFVVYIGFKIYLGIKGRELAKDSDTFASDEQRIGFFKGFDWAGKVLFWAMVAVFVLGIILTVATGLSLSSAIDTGTSLPQ